MTVGDDPCAHPEVDRLGHVVRGVYDGVLFWSCKRCGVAWPKFRDDGRLADASRLHVARYLEARDD